MFQNRFGNNRTTSITPSSWCGDVEGALEDCGRAGVPVATIFTDGFADAGAEGLARQQRLAARAKALGVRMLGPNSMGMINLGGRARSP